MTMTREQFFDLLNRVGSADQRMSWDSNIGAGRIMRDDGRLDPEIDHRPQLLGFRQTPQPTPTNIRQLGQ